MSGRSDMPRAKTIIRVMPRRAKSDGVRSRCSLPSHRKRTEIHSRCTIVAQFHALLGEAVRMAAKLPAPFFKFVCLKTTVCGQGFPRKLVRIKSAVCEQREGKVFGQLVAVVRK